MRGLLRRRPPPSAGDVRRENWAYGELAQLYDDPEDQYISGLMHRIDFTQGEAVWRYRRWAIVGPARSYIGGEPPLWVKLLRLTDRRLVALQFWALCARLADWWWCHARSCARLADRWWCHARSRSQRND